MGHMLLRCAPPPEFASFGHPSAPATGSIRFFHVADCLPHGLRPSARPHLLAHARHAHAHGPPLPLQYQIFFNTIRHVMDGRLRRNNSTGVTGVRIVRNQCMILYAASITVRGKFIYLGRFPTLGEAKKARKEAEKKYFAPLLDDDPPGHEETGGKNHDETR